MALKIFALIGSTSTIAFGAWHLFVPKIYNWYSYISDRATELIAAVRAINVFFSLSLILIGAANIIFVFAGNRFSKTILFALSCILWGARVVMQIVYPQGSIKPALQYTMLVTFILIFVCFIAAFLLTLTKN